MNEAYKQEKKKNAKRRTHSTPSVTFKMTDPLFSEGDPPSPKKLKDSLYLSFPVETVLTTEQSGSEDIKTELEYHLAEPDVHWGQFEKTQDRELPRQVWGRRRKYRCAVQGRVSWTLLAEVLCAAKDAVVKGTSVNISFPQSWCWFHFVMQSVFRLHCFE